MQHPFEPLRDLWTKTSLTMQIQMQKTPDTLVRWLCDRVDRISPSLGIGPSSLISYTCTISDALKCALISSRDHEGDYSDTTVQVNSGGLAVLRPGPLSGRKERMTAPIKHASVEVLSLPDHATTLRLIESYFDHVGSLFPYLHRQTFLATYAQLRTGTCKTRRLWLAMLNLVLAMALQRASGPGQNANESYQDPWTCYERATSLCDWQITTGDNLETGMSEACSNLPIPNLLTRRLCSPILLASHTILARY